MKYRFRYESLLKYRNFLKKEAELQFSKVLAHNRELNRRKKNLLATIDRMLSEARQLLSEGTTAGKYQQMVNYVEELKMRLKMLEKEIEKSNKEVEIARQQLVNRMVDVEVLEKLSSRDFEDYKKQLKLKETRTNDELYLLKFNNT
jgi:flagellar export protein FliJ